VATYTQAQAVAIACLNEPLQIIACAGSGKTQVISQRISSILAQPGAAPKNIIAFTFTDGAAAELKERILSILQKEGVATVGLAEMYICTMHGYALDLLQRLVPETFKFSVLTEITSRMLIDRNSRKSGLTVCPTSSSGTPYLRRFLHSRLFLQATSVAPPAGQWLLVCLVPEGVKNLDTCSLEVLGVPRDNRQAVHLGSGSDQPVYDGKRLRVLLAPPGGGDRQRDGQDPVRESELDFPQPALKARRLLIVSATANT
jgi:hypothetical protein